jgi:glyoxylase-like metal-dependent hydrolase (beta-lactamase superfamily II)
MTSEVKWFGTEQLGDGVIRITEPFVHSFYRANFYRIAGRDFDIQFDFGVGVQSLTSALPQTNHPVFAIASHAHVDHIGNFHEYDRRAGHRVEANAFAALDDAGTVQSWFRRQERPVERLPYPGWTIADYGLRPAPLTEFLDDGDVVDLGNRKFTVLHLPGHSPGSIALLDEFDGTFFSGDAVYDDKIVDDAPTASVESYLKTMRRLLELDITVGHGGHGPSFDTRRMHEKARAYIASRGGRSSGNKKGQTLV